MAKFCRFQFTVTQVRNESIKIYKDVEIFQKIVSLANWLHWNQLLNVSEIKICIHVSNIGYKYSRWSDGLSPNLKKGLGLELGLIPKRNNSVFKHLNIWNYRAIQVKKDEKSIF